jgi:hypothetical protein
MLLMTTNRCPALQLENYIRAPWYILFSPLWLGHAVCVVNQISFFKRGVRTSYSTKCQQLPLLPPSSTES